jgi:hypothetical protein
MIKRTTLFSLAMILSLSVILLIGCSIPRTNEDAASFGIPAKDLLLDTESFPAGWTFNPCGDNCERIEGAAHAERSYFLPEVPGLVLLEISRFVDVDDSSRKYKTYLDTEFRERVPPNVQFTTPSAASFQSNFADEYHFGCGIDEVPGCRAILRYGNYFVHLYASWDTGNGEGLQLSEIQQLLQALDERAVARLR